MATGWRLDRGWTVVGQWLDRGWMEAGWWPQGHVPQLGSYSHGSKKAEQLQASAQLDQICSLPRWLFSNTSSAQLLAPDGPLDQNLVPEETRLLGGLCDEGPMLIPRDWLWRWTRGLVGEETQGEPQKWKTAVLGVYYEI